MRYTLPIFIGAALLLIQSSPAATIANGGFEEPVMTSTFQVFPTGSSIGDWEVINDPLLLLRSDYTEIQGGIPITFPSHGGNQHLDITGSGNTGNGGVQQKVATIPGLVYILSFWVGNMDDAIVNYTLPSSIQLLIDGSDHGTFTNSSSTSQTTNWQLFSHSFTAQTDSTVIGFVNATPAADNMAGLDDINIIAIPEPSTWILTLSSAGLLLITRGRRR